MRARGKEKKEVELGARNKRNDEAEERRCNRFPLTSGPPNRSETTTGPSVSALQRGAFSLGCLAGRVWTLGTVEPCEGKPDDREASSSNYRGYPGI